MTYFSSRSINCADFLFGQFVKWECIFYSTLLYLHTQTHDRQQFFWTTTLITLFDLKSNANSMWKRNFLIKSDNLLIYSLWQHQIFLSPALCVWVVQCLLIFFYRHLNGMWFMLICPKRKTYAVVYLHKNHNQFYFLFAERKYTTQKKRIRYGGQRVLNECDHREFVATWHVVVGERLLKRTIQ